MVSESDLYPYRPWNYYSTPRYYTTYVVGFLLIFGLQKSKQLEQLMTRLPYNAEKAHKNDKPIKPKNDHKYKTL